MSARELGIRPRQRLEHRRVKLLLDLASYGGSPRGLMSIPIIIPRIGSGFVHAPQN
jgi:hypothetical protein